VKLTPADVQAVLNIKQAEGLAPRTVQYIHATLRASLGVAMRWGLVERNVATLTEPIRLSRPPVIPFSLDEVKRLLKASAEDRLAAFWTVAVAIGLRPSEALALRWSDVDLDARRVFVRNTLEWRTGSWSLKQPKSRTSRRIISLPKVCAEALRAHRVRQSEVRLAAEEWDDQDFVFTTDTGGPLSRWQINYRFDRLQERAGVRHHRLYDCRHTAASLLLAQGVAPRVVMEILGHSSYSLTMDTYTHVLPTLLSDAADAMDRTLAEF
jgi:integrase